jgi:cytochrome c
MKKVLIVLCVGIAVAISACGGGAKQGTSDSTAAANQTAKESESSVDTNATKTGTEDAGAPSSAPGAKLIAANDCSTCHKVDTKVIGPAFQDIAAKYPATDANIETLAKKVISGGKGNWGEIAMTPHANLSLDDAKTMVKYILSLKK